MKKKEIITSVILLVGFALLLIYSFQPVKPPSERLLDVLKESKTQKMNNISQ